MCAKSLAFSFMRLAVLFPAGSRPKLLVQVEEYMYDCYKTANACMHADKNHRRIRLHVVIWYHSRVLGSSNSQKDHVNTCKL